MVAIDYDNHRRCAGFSAVFAIVGICAFILYWLTCFRTFTWWDSSEYSVAALTLGIPHPPGSLLTVIAGWLASKLPLGIDNFFALNLLSSLMAAITLYVVGYIALILSREVGCKNGRSNTWSQVGEKAGISFGTLAFGLSITMWYYAIRFTPYMTTALTTALIIWAMLNWHWRFYESNSHLWFALVTLLFGLDFSVHRTNLLLMPALILWVSILHPGAFLNARYWIIGIAGLVAGMSVQLLLIPIAAARPFINFNDPSSLSRLWDYVTLKQYGGGWLINMFPRKAPFFDVQVADYLNVFRDNFANGNLGLIGYLPFVTGIAGLALILRRNWKLGMGLSLLFLFASAGAILYFNLPLNFFRSIDRHYMPSFVVFAIFMAYGCGAFARAMMQGSGVSRIPASIIAIILLVSMPLEAVIMNYGRVDGSKSFFAYDTAKNYLSTLPEKAILYTQADIDTYTLWCLQVAEKYRQDVTICNLSLLNTPWFIRQILERDADYPARLDEDEIASLAIIQWRDSAIAFPVAGNAEEFDLPPGTVLPDSIKITVSPSYANQFLFVHDQILLKTISANRWGRPICFSTLVPEASISWLMQFSRLEGMYRRIVPVMSPEAEMRILSRNLLENISLRGFADGGIPKEDPTKWVGWNICGSFVALSSMESSSGDTAACLETIDKLNSRIIIDDLAMPNELRAAIDNACK